MLVSVIVGARGSNTPNVQYVVRAKDKKNEIVTIMKGKSFPLLCVNCMTRFNTCKIKHVRINAVGVVGIEQIASVKVSAIVSGGENVCASMVGQQKSIRTYARELLEAVIEKSIRGIKTVVDLDAS